MSDSEMLFDAVTRITIMDTHIKTVRGVVSQNMSYAPPEHPVGRALKDTWPLRVLEYLPEQWEVISVELKRELGVPETIAVKVLVRQEEIQYPAGTDVEVTFHSRHRITGPNKTVVGVRKV